MNRPFAQTLSYLLHPAVFPLLGVLAVLQFTPYYIPQNAVILTLVLVFTGTYVLPISISYLLYRMGFIAGIEMKSARERKIPYLIGALSYYGVALLIEKLELPREAYLFLLSSALLILLHLVSLMFLKPSAHLAGIGGFTALLFALSLKFQINLLPLIAFCILLSGFLATARLHLKAHSMLEIGLGYLSGLIIMFVMLIQ